MTKSVDSSEHPSSSHVQKEIEQYIINKWSLSVPDKDNHGFQIDGWQKSGDNIIILAEIYASLGELNRGGKNKILADMFKLVSYVKVHDLNGVELQIILTSEEAVEKLNSENRSNSWIKKAIETHDIKIKYFDELPDDLKAKLVLARERQKEGIKKRKNEKL